MAQGMQVIQNEMVICGEDIASAMARANKKLIDCSVPDMFVTVWAGIVTLSTGDLVFVNAGHNYAAINKADHGFKIEKDKHSMALAALKTAKFKENRIKLKPGDTIFLYTDGVTEARNREGELFGKARLVETLDHAPDLSQEELIHHVTSCVTAFMEDAEQYDDMTMLCFRKI